MAVNDSTQIRVHTDFPDVRLTIPGGSALDYLAVRSSHLTALMNMLCADGEEQCDKAARETLLWLAYSIATEVDSLAQAVARD